MPLTGAGAGDSEIDPYADLEEEVAQEAVEEPTQPSEEETEAPIADAGEPEPEQEPEPEVEYVQVSAEELAQMQKKLAHQETHIGRIEGENQGLRTVTETYQQPAAPEPPPPPVSMLEDEATQSLIQRAYEEDPVQAMTLVGKYLEKTVQEQIQKAVKPIAAQTTQHRQLQQYQDVVNEEIAQAAAEIPGAQEIVQEYIASNGQAGRLVEKIVHRGEQLKSMGLDAQMAVTPGNFRSALAEIVIEQGGVPTPASRPAATGARPKATQTPRRTEPKPNEESEEDQWGDAIVKSEKTREKMAKILGG